MTRIENHILMCVQNGKLVLYHSNIFGKTSVGGMCTWGGYILRPRQNGRHFPDDIFKWFFWNENVSIAIKISLKFVPKGPINNIPALVQIMAWCRPGDKPLSEAMMVSFPTHIPSPGLNELTPNLWLIYQLCYSKWIATTFMWSK